MLCLFAVIDCNLLCKASENSEEGTHKQSVDTTRKMYWFLEVVHVGHVSTFVAWDKNKDVVQMYSSGNDIHCWLLHQTCCYLLYLNICLQRYFVTQ